VFGQKGGDADRLRAKIAAAVDLVAEHDARALGVLRTHGMGIFVFSSGGAAECNLRARLVVFDREYVSKAGTSVVTLAATLVHEATHAWLEAAGFRYTTDRRARIERICYRRARRLVRRIPGQEALARWVEEQSARDPAYLTNAAFRQRLLDEARRGGVPGWLIAAIERLAALRWRLVRSRRRRVAGRS